jgi:RNA polymerase sigma-70 factor, ECF subfamily
MSSFHTAVREEEFLHRADEASAEAGFRVERTDKLLVELVLGGDAFAFEEIFDRHKRLVAVVASRYFRRPEEIEEIVQIAFAKAFTQLESFRGNYDRSLSSWLVKITCNACFDILRTQKRKPERLNCDLSDAEADALLELTADNSLAPEKNLLDRDLADKLLAAVPEDDRLLLHMLYAEEMTTADIADAMGITRANVKVRAWRARTSLKKILKRLL